MKRTEISRVLSAFSIHVFRRKNIGAVSHYVTSAHKENIKKKKNTNHTTHALYKVPTLALDMLLSDRST